MYPSLYAKPQASPWNFGDTERPDMPLPIMVNPPALAPLARMPPKSGMGASESSSLDTMSKGATLRNIYPTLPELTDITRNVEQLEPFVAQKAQLDANRDLLRQQLTQRPGLDLATPLANLSDYISSGKLGNRQPAITALDAAKQLREYAKQQQDDQRDYTKSVVSAASGIKAGTESQLLQQALAQKLGLTSGDPFSRRGGAGDPDDNRAFRAHLATVQAIKRDPQLQRHMQSYSSLGNALAIISNADVVPPAQLHEAQQTVRRALNITGTSGVGERERTYISDLGLDLDNITAYLDDRLAKVNKNDPILRHVQDLATVEQANIQKLVGDRLDVASGGNGWVYTDPRYAPRYKPSLDQLTSAVRKQVGSPGATASKPQKKSPGIDIKAMIEAELNKK